jgi:hypothetical protein
MVWRGIFVVLSLLTLVIQKGTSALVPIVIAGKERIGWNQAADSEAQAARFRYVVYIDGTPVELTGGSCGRSFREATFSCSAPLPPLSFGVHTIDIAIHTYGPSAEIGRSNHLRVLVIQPSPSPAPTGIESTIGTGRHAG